MVRDDGVMGANEDVDGRARLRLVDGSGASALETGLAAVPLGPWAGAAVEVWTSRTGQVWHADPDCADLRTRGRHAVHRQPISGSLADVVLPDRLHCQPVGELSDYWAAAGCLVSYESDIQSMVEKLADADLPLLDAIQFLERRSTVDENRRRLLEDGALAQRWAAVQRDYEGLADRVRGAFAADGERAARMCAAVWVRTGRTPREHQDRYATFLHAAVEELDRRGVSYQGYEREAVNTDRLPVWLETVGDGSVPASATAAMIDTAVGRSGNRQLPDGTRAPVAAAWAAVGQRWEALLHGLTLGHPGELVAVFHRYGIQTPLWRVLPHASIDVGELDWVVARLPAAARPLLSGRDRGLTARPGRRA